ncbi:hypothetical protein IJ531_00695 [bacterium]|nr:hypothetical protein [bacterium]
MKYPPKFFVLNKVIDAKSAQSIINTLDEIWQTSLNIHNAIILLNASAPTKGSKQNNKIE